VGFYVTGKVAKGNRRNTIVIVVYELKFLFCLSSIIVQWRWIILRSERKLWYGVSW